MDFQRIECFQRFYKLQFRLAGITGKDLDELCIKRYVWMTNQMTHLKLSKRKNLYLDICQSCKQFFADDEECLNSSLNLSLHSTGKSKKASRDLHGATKCVVNAYVGTYNILFSLYIIVC
ncbi:hypothetical protein POVWA2_036200 [Plasmodium ovale wallikeri]|uniref:Uncharacterized protein n=1 Tax=Plasmodium ovale wallikeri TaxID=864142 RepID=A0A1A8Z3X4_PLAOA|nr:hypothetical protein POVWA2_036200 [Plasmodium ovale wallikeri]